MLASIKQLNWLSVFMQSSRHCTCVISQYVYLVLFINQTG